MLTEGTTVAPKSPYEVTQSGVDDVVAVIGGQRGGVEAPPSFVNVVLAPAIKEFLQSSDVPLSGVVHTSESVTYTRLLRVGDVVKTSVTVTSVRARVSVTQFEILSLVTDLEGQELVRVNSALICETEAAE